MSLWSRLRRLAGRDALHRATRSEERLALALEAAGMAIWEMDTETGAMWWSDEARRLFGLAAGSTAPQPRLPHVLQHLEHRPHLRMLSNSASASCTRICNTSAIDRP